MYRRRRIKIFLTKAINVTSGEGSAKNNSPDGEKNMKRSPQLGGRFPQQEAVETTLSSKNTCSQAIVISPLAPKANTAPHFEEN